MAGERGARSQLVLGTVRAEVALIKTSARPSEAKYDTRRVLPDGTPLVPREVPAGTPLGVATDVDSLGATGPVAPAHDPLGPPEPEPPYPGKLATPPPGFEPLPSQRESAAADLTAALAGDDDAAVSAAQEFDDAMAGEPTPEPETVVQRGIWRDIEVNGEPDREWVDLTDQLAAIDERTQLVGMSVAATVRASSIPAGRVRDSYYVAPAAEGAGGVLALLWTGLRKHRAAALVVWSKRTNQALGAVVARGTAEKPHLELMELEWEANLRPVLPRCNLAGAMEQVAGNERALAAAERLVAAYREKPSIFEALRDECAGQRIDLLNAAREGRDYEAPVVAAAPEAAVDLAAALA